jgi:hypothetical protein
MPSGSGMLQHWAEVIEEQERGGNGEQLACSVNRA